MKYIKLSIRFVALSVLVANTLLLAQVVTGTDTPTASALTNLECYQRYDGKGSGAQIDEDDKLTGAQYDRFKKSDCATGKNPPCKSSEGSNGYVINCTVSANNQCKADFDGKKIPGDLDLDEYQESGCSDLSGGPCKTNDTPSVSTVSCGAGAPGTDNEDKDSDSGEGPDSNIGEEFKEDDCKPSSAQDLSSDNCEVIEIIVLITNVISGLAATIIVAMIILGGIQYSMAGSDASKVQAAKQKITNALLALLLLVFGFSIIQWLIPGGLI